MEQHNRENSNRKNNPFTLDFGRIPKEIIPRVGEMEELMDAFMSDSPSQHISMITGIRGIGKTVFMTAVCRRIAENKDWVVVDLNTEQDLLQTLVNKLMNEERLSGIFEWTQENHSSFEASVNKSGARPKVSPEIILVRMLESVKKHGKRLLIAIDEAVSNQNMRIFASNYQMLPSQDYPVFLLMTGLYENIRKLQDEKTLTFLYRAPGIILQPLDIGTIADCYERIFCLERGQAMKMAKETRGYSFAFQVLGYFTWQYSQEPERVRSLYRHCLEECVYEKVWEEMSPSDRKVAIAIAEVPSGSILEIRKLLGMETNQFNPYRMRLIRKGIVDGEDYGELKFVLPLFEEFIKSQQ